MYTSPFSPTVMWFRLFYKGFDVGLMSDQRSDLSLEVKTCDGLSRTKTSVMLNIYNSEGRYEEYYKGKWEKDA